MWEPVEVWEWLEDHQHDAAHPVWYMRLPGSAVHRVWHMQVQALDDPTRLPWSTSCGLYRYGGETQRPVPLVDGQLMRQYRPSAWQDYAETGRSPTAGWPAWPGDRRVRYEEQV